MFVHDLTLICFWASSTRTKGCFIYILDRSNSSSFTFWSSKLASSNRSNWNGIWTSNSNGSWTDKHSSHFSTAKEMSVKATFKTKLDFLQTLCTKLFTIAWAQIIYNFFWSEAKTRKSLPRLYPLILLAVCKKHSLHCKYLVSKLHIYFFCEI